MKKFKLFKALMLMVSIMLISPQVWGAASTSSDSKYVTGKVTFESVGTLSVTTNYWYNGIKFYPYNSSSVSASTSAWSSSVSIPTYISNATASKDNNKGKWGKNGTGKQYTMSGIALNCFAMGIHVNKKCTLEVVVDRNWASDTDDASIAAAVESAVAYGTGWTSSNYKTAGATALTVTSTRADGTNTPGRYTLTIPITSSGEKVVKMLYSSSGSGSGKLFCFESVTVYHKVSHSLTNVTKAVGTKDTTWATSNYTATYTANDGYTLPSTITVTIDGSTKTAGTHYTWNQGTGVLTINKSAMTGGDIVVTIAGEAASSCSDDTGLAYGETTVNKTYGDAVFTNTLTNSNSLSVTYSSTNTSVATVNGSTGAVTIKAAGTATIKATWAGNATYCKDEVSYTLNVKPAVGEVSGAWDRFGGETISLSVTPSGGSSYSYQWKKWYNDQWNNIAGATSATYTKSECDKDDSGSYSCAVTSAGQTNETDGYQVKVFVLECYTGGTTVYNFTRNGNNQRGSVNIDLSASTSYEFKVHADNDYYGNNGTVNEDITNWVLCNNDNEYCNPNLHVNSGLGGTFTFTMDYSAEGNSDQVGEPELSVTYPRKRIYLSPGVWDAAGAKFAYYYFRDGGSTAWTDFLTRDDCGNYADIPQWNGVKVIAGRINGDLDAPAFGDNKCWNQTNNITVGSYDYITITGWNASDYTYNSTYAAPTYTISYNKGTSGSGTKSNETKTCGMAFTLPSSAVFTRTGYTQTGWTTSDGGAQEYALGGTYTTNEDKTFYPVWTVNNYNLTWNLGGGTTTSAGTGIASGVSVNTTSSVAYGTSLTAPTVTKANYDFSAWSPSVASKMPASNTTYTATFTAKKYNVSTSLTDMTVSSGTTGSNAATYGTNYTLTLAADDGFVLPGSITVTIGGDAAPGGSYTYNSSTGVVTITGSYITGAIVITAAGAEDVYRVTYAGNGNTGGTVPTDETAYDPDDEVTVASGVPTKSGSTFVGWLNSTNNTIYRAGQTFTITANTTLTAQWSTPTVTTYYYGGVSISAGALVQGTTSSVQFFTYANSTFANSTAITLSSTPSTTGIYSNTNSVSNWLTTSNWTTSSSSNRYIQGVDFVKDGSYTLALGSKVATSIRFIGFSSQSGTRTMTVGGVGYSTSSQNTIYSYEYTKSGNFTGNVTITQDGSFRGILIITVSTPTGYNVTFNASGKSATGMPSNYSGVPSGKKIAAPIEIPTVTNYIFDGWVTTSGGSTAFDFANTTITADKTIYAKWTAKTAPTQYTFSLSDPCASATPSATLSGSQSGWSYQLYKNGAVSGDPKAGTGKALTWTGLTAGSYYVKTVETSTQASAQIGSSATVYAGTTITSNLSSSRSVNANVSTTVSFVASGANLSYQWYTCNSDGTGKVAIDGKEAPTFAYTFTNDDAPTKYICCVATGTCGTVTSNIQAVTINRTYYLTVDLDGGSWSGGISSGYRTVSTFNIPTPIPTKSGHVFLGWSFLGNTYQPGAAITPNQTATLRALWASPCFNVSDASKKTMPDGQPAGTVITGGGMINGTITGGTLTYTGTDAAGLNGNAKGLIFNNDNDELTVNITDGMLQEGTVIVIGSYGTASSSSHTNGLKVSGNNMSPATVVSSTSNNSISQRYVVADGDGIEGTSSFTIRRVASTDQMMLNTISVAGCQSCTAITPTLSYSSTTLYAFGGMPRGAVPTLTGNTGNGAVSYSSSNTNVVTVDSETGVVTAVGCGSATVSAIIEPNGGYCGAVRSVNFTVPALVTQTIRVGTSTSWNGDGSAAPDMSFNDPTSTTSQVAVIANSGYTFDATTASDKANMTRKFTGTAATKGAKYVTLKFKNATHNLRLGEVIARIQPVTSNGKAQVEIYEGSTLRLTSSEVTGITQGQLNDVRFTFASPYVFAANTNIEVRLYFYGQTDGFRLGTPFYVNGGVLVDQRFTDANSTGLWSDPANWDGGALPEIYHDVILQKPCSVDIAHATAKSIVIDQNSKTGKLTIGPNKGLEVAETVQKTTDGSSYSGTGEADLVLESSSAGNASLIFNNNNHCQATVQMYSKASVEGNTWNWQYVGTPFENEIPLYNYYGGYMYKWNGTGWDVVHGTDELTPFAGYCLTQASPTTHYMSGELIATDGNDYSVTINSADKDMVLANSWTAPISICSFTASTFTSTPATIYLFNTGSAENGSSEGEAAGTYITVPINSAVYTGNGLIAPMQGFFVTTNDGTAGKITMKYNELVRTTTNHTDIVAGPMKSPTRERVDYGEPDVMKIRVNGSTYMDRVIILAREDFSEGFDNGWDGEKKGYNSIAPAVFVINEEGKNDAVSAIPEYEGTLVGFRAGSEDNVYTMTFEYNGDEVLYLNDLKAQMSAEIANGQTYMFTTEDGDSEVRFIISHNPIRRITTGVDDVETGTKARKVLINEKIYIIRKGRVYSVDGQIVK